MPAKRDTLTGKGGSARSTTAASSSSSSGSSKGKKKPSVVRSAAATLLCAVLVLGVTWCYFTYRLAHVEKVAGSAEDEAEDDQAHSSPSTLRTDSKASVNLASQPYPYGWYQRLRPHAALVNETILNPQLVLFYGPARMQAVCEGEGQTTTAPAHAGSPVADAAERAKDARVAAACASMPAVRRYLLTDTQLGQRYMLRLSYLGSPSVSYRIHLYHIRASTVRRERHRVRSNPTTTASMAAATGAFLSARETIPQGKLPARLSVFTPTDTELATITMHRRYASQFAKDETIIYDGADLLHRAEEEEARAKTLHRGDGAAGGGAAEAAEADGDPFVAVVEITAKVQSFAADPRDFPVLSFNVELNPLLFNLLPEVGLPLIACFSLVTMVLGKYLIYRWVSSAVFTSAEGAADTDDSADELTGGVEANG